MIPNNQELEYIRRAAGGDHEAFRLLVLLYETPVLAYLYSLLGNWENARDLAQETFIAAFYALPRWQSPEPLSRGQSIPQQREATIDSPMDHPLAPWLYRIATNQALTFLKQQRKKKQREAPLPLQYSTDQSSISQGKPQGDVAIWEDRYVMRELLREALCQLSADEALCIILRFVVGERYAEIAERLGTTKEAIRKRVTRGLVALRFAYQALDQEEE